MGNPVVLPLSRAPLPQPLCALPSGGCQQDLRCVKGRARTRTWLMLQPPSAPLPLTSSAPPKPRPKPRESLLYSVPTYSRPAPLAAKSRRHCYHKSAVKSLHASENLERDSLYGMDIFIPQMLSRPRLATRTALKSPGWKWRFSYFQNRILQKCRIRIAQFSWQLFIFSFSSYPSSYFPFPIILSPRRRLQSGM